VTRLRRAGHHADLYPKTTKLQKMMKYADQRNAPRVLIIGSQEVASGEYSLKTMATGEQEKVTEATLLELLK
jgi:histidyl-tRNA synthetase